MRTSGDPLRHWHQPIVSEICMKTGAPCPSVENDQGERSGAACSGVSGASTGAFAV